MSQIKLDYKKMTEVVSAVLTDEANSLLSARSRVEKTVVEAAEIIMNHPGKVVICG